MCDPHGYTATDVFVPLRPSPRTSSRIAFGCRSRNVFGGDEKQLHLLIFLLIHTKLKFFYTLVPNRYMVMASGNIARKLPYLNVIQKCMSPQSSSLNLIIFFMWMNKR